MKSLFLVLSLLCISIYTMGQKSEKQMFELITSTVDNPKSSFGFLIHEKGDLMLYYNADAKRFTLLTLDENANEISRIVYSNIHDKIGAITHASITEDSIYLLTFFNNKEKETSYFFHLTIDRKSETVGALKMIHQVPNDFAILKILESPNSKYISLFLVKGNLFNLDASSQIILVFDEKLHLNNADNTKIISSEMGYSVNGDMTLDDEGNLLYISRGYKSQAEYNEGKSYSIYKYMTKYTVFRRDQLGVLSIIIYQSHQDYQPLRIVIPENRYYFREYNLHVLRPDSILFTGAYSLAGSINFDGFGAFWLNPYEDESIDTSKISTLPFTLEMRMQGAEEKEKYSLKSTKFNKELVDFYSLHAIGVFKMGDNYVALQDEMASFGFSMSLINNLIALQITPEGKLVDYKYILKRQFFSSAYYRNDITAKKYNDKLYIAYTSNSKTNTNNPKSIFLTSIEENLNHQTDMLDIGEMKINSIRLIGQLMDAKPLIEGKVRIKKDKEKEIPFNIHILEP